MAGTKETAAGETELPPNQATTAPLNEVRTASPPRMTVYGGNEVVVARCECCKLSDEYTRAYVAQIRSQHCGRWMCDLCMTAVKDEMVKSNNRLTLEEALNRHFKFHQGCRSAPVMPVNEFIDFMKYYLFKNAVTIDRARSNPSSPAGNRGGSGKKFTRSTSCFPSMDA